MLITSNITNRVYDSRAKNIPPHERPAILWMTKTQSPAYVCVIQEDGTLKAWGDANFVANTPSDKFISLTRAGGTSTCAGITENGEIKFWSATTVSSAVSNIPLPNNYIKVECIGTTACALRPDGSVVCWGNLTEVVDNVPARNDIIDIALGSSGVIALTTNNDIITWGNSSFPNIELNKPSQAKQISLYGGYASALLLDNTSFSWGYDSDFIFNTHTIFLGGSGSSTRLSIDENNIPIAWRATTTSIATQLPQEPVSQIYTCGDTRIAFATTAEGKVIGWGDYIIPFLPTEEIFARKLYTLYFLLKINNLYYTWRDNALVEVGNVLPTQELFISDGFVDLNSVNWNSIADNVEILAYSDKNELLLVGETTPIIPNTIYAYRNASTIPILSTEYSKNVGSRIIKKG